MSLEEEALDRLKQARARKADVEPELIEAYGFAAHWRARVVSSETDTGKGASRDKERDNLPSTDLLTEVSGDFVSHIVDTFMPRYTDWAKRGQGMFTSDQDWKSVARQVEIGDATIMNAIRSSGFYAAANQAFNPDLYIGTCAMWIDPAQVAFHYPACWGVPIRELEINIGPLGTVDDRFVVKYMNYDAAARLIGSGATMPAKNSGNYDTKTRCQVVLGFWGLYDTTGVTKWQYVALFDKKLVKDVVLEGEGSSPLIVFRWEPDGVFGVGPAIKSLPSARVLDQLAEGQQDRAEHAINPAFLYANDGMTNFEGGIQAGMGYPSLPGSGKDITPLFFDGDPNAGFYTVQDLEMHIRRLAYVDFPEQPGKTPPTEAQWLDQMVKAQRRIGPPGEMFWREGPREVFSRFQFILEKAGRIKPAARPGANEGELVSLEPYNPAARAQSLERVEQSVKFVQIARLVAPEESTIAIDGMKSIANIKDELKESVVVMRDKKDIEAAVGMMSQLAGGGAGGGEAAPAAQMPQ